MLHEWTFSLSPLVHRQDCAAALCEVYYIECNFPPYDAKCKLNKLSEGFKLCSALQNKNTWETLHLAQYTDSAHTHLSFQHWYVDRNVSFRLVTPKHRQIFLSLRSTGIKILSLRGIDWFYCSCLARQSLSCFLAVLMRSIEISRQSSDHIL